MTQNISLTQRIEAALQDHNITTVDGFVSFNPSQITEELKDSFPQASPAKIEAVIEKYQQKNLSFQPPAQKNRLLESWADRSRIIKKRIIPGLAIAGITGLLATGIYGVKSELLNRAERDVEQQFISYVNDAQTLSTRIQSLENNPTVISLPDDERVTFHYQLDLARASLGEDDSSIFVFGDQPGEISESITRQNFKQAKEYFPSAQRDVAQVSEKVANAQGILENHLALENHVKELESIYAQIEQLETHPAIQKNADLAYKAGLQQIQNRSSFESEKAIQSLKKIRGDALRFEGLSQSYQRLSTNLETLAKGPRAIEESQRVTELAQTYANSGDVANFAAAVKQMSQLESTISNVYRITIVGGVWRYSNENRNIKNYYLRVQAQDRNGRAVPMQIRNEENGLVEVVNEWAERVPKHIYDRVGADKSDNHIIDDNLFGRKKAGYLDLDTQGYERIGQITRW